jgi:hypothetical protein
MKFLKILILGPLSILSLKSTAQVEDLMRDKNIIWIGEFTSDFVVEGDKKVLDTMDYINSTQLMKYFNPKLEPFSFDEETPFAEKIHRLGYNDNPITFSNSNCTNRINPFQLVDTIFRTDTITNEKKYGIALRCFYIAPIPRFYRVRQVLFYDKKKANFGLRVLAIGLIVDNMSESGEIVGQREEGWIKPANIGHKKINFNDPNITIAKRLKSGRNSPSFDKDVKVLKNTNDDIQQTFLDDLSRKSSINLYGDEGDYSKKFTKTVRDSLLKNIQQLIAESKIPKDSTKLALQKDSVKIKYVYYNRSNADVGTDAFPDFSRMGKDSAVKHKIEIDTSQNKGAVIDSFLEYIPQPIIDPFILYGSKAIYKLRIIQDWYWDEKLKNICVRLFAIAPMKKVYNEAGEFLFDIPLFYRLND